jgi:hypothetical protein
VDGIDLEVIVNEIKATFSDGSDFDPSKTYNCPVCSPVRSGKNIKRSMKLVGPQYVEGRGYRALFRCGECGRESFKSQYPVPEHILKEIASLKLQQYSSRQIAAYITQNLDWKISAAGVNQVIRRSKTLADIPTLRSRPIEKPPAPH